MPVKAADPEAVKLDEAFAEAMNVPGKPREPGPPPEVDREAPFGRDDAGAPLAPFGLTRDGKPKRSAAGRKPAEDRARTGTAPAKPDAGDGAGKPPAAAAEPQRYAAAIAETLEVFWLGGTVLGQVGPGIPVVLLYKDNIAGALDLCAQHNEQARRLAVKLSSGTAGWALNAAFMLLPVISTSLKIWSNPDRDYDAEGSPLPSVTEQLAANNRESFQAYMADLAKKAEAAAQQETPQAA